MPTFHIRVHTKSGQIKTGYLPAENEQELNRKLREHGWTLLEIIPDQTPAPPIEPRPVIAPPRSPRPGYRWAIIIPCAVVAVLVIAGLFSSLTDSGSSWPPDVAGNGDRRGFDNDGDGRTESQYVRGYTRSDGVQVRDHYRAHPWETASAPSARESGRPSGELHPIAIILIVWFVIWIGSRLLRKGEEPK